MSPSPCSRRAAGTFKTCGAEWYASELKHVLAELNLCIRAPPATSLAPHYTHPCAVVLADVQAATLFEGVFLAVVLTDARPAALLAHASSAVVLSDARDTELSAVVSLAVVLTDARPATVLVQVSFRCTSLSSRATRCTSLSSRATRYNEMALYLNGLSRKFVDK
jgi:hypothetical protein